MTHEIVQFHQKFYTLKGIDYKDELCKYIVDNNINDVLKANNPQELQILVEETLQDFADVWLLEDICNANYCIVDNFDEAKGVEFYEYCLDNNSKFNPNIYF